MSSWTEVKTLPKDGDSWPEAKVDWVQREEAERRIVEVAVDAGSTEYLLHKRIEQLEFQVQKLTVEKEDNFQLACDWEQQFRELEAKIEKALWSARHGDAAGAVQALGGDDVN